jgi:hypothetical protein
MRLGEFAGGNGRKLQGRLSLRYSLREFASYTGSRNIQLSLENAGDQLRRRQVIPFFQTLIAEHAR